MGVYKYNGDAVTIDTDGISTPEHYGAVGDGQTDDTSAIQAAVNNAGLILFGAGKQYKISSPIRLKKGTVVDLNGAAIVSSDNHAFYNFLDGDSYSEYNGNGNIKIRNGRIIGGCISFIHGDNIRVTGVGFENCLNDHFMEICACKDYVIEGCSFVGMKYRANATLEYINFDTNASYAAFPHNRAGQSDSTFYDMSVSEGVTVHDCYFSIGSGDYAYGFNAIGAHARNVNGTYTKDVTLINNTIRGFTGCGIRVNAMDGIMVSDNDIQTTGDGIRIGDVADSKNIVIKDNYVQCSGTNLVRTSGRYADLTVFGNGTKGDTQEF